MRKVRKNILDRPGSLIEGFHHYDNAISALGLSKSWPTNYSKVYKSERVKDALNLIYNEKCAFCNQEPKGSPLQVEHFRPKKGINGEEHTGYYWLGYEWSNLLLACGNCNSTKKNHFPLKPGIERVSGPSWINENVFRLEDCLSNSLVFRQEEYILLNPEIDNPKNHLFYEQDGRINHFPGDTRGEESIEKYNLNRDELYLNGRKELLDDLVEKIGKRYNDYSHGDINHKALYIALNHIIVENIIDPIIQKKSFDHFRHCIYSHFDDYILPYIGPTKLKSILLYIFKNLHLNLLRPGQYL